MTLIDVEDLIQWAMDQTGYLPWRGVTARELMFDHGYTVIPTGCTREYHGGRPLLRRAVDDDAAAVIEAIKELPATTAAMVIACGREKTRPNWLPGVEPRLVTRSVYRRKRGKKRHRTSIIKAWDIDPAVIWHAHDKYEEWHDGVRQVMCTLAAALINYEIKGFAALKRPWEEVVAQAA